MLSIGPMSSTQANYYLDLAQEDYYLKGGEPEGVWHGGGTKFLGLQGTVEGSHLRNLFKGIAPEGDRFLTQRQRHEGKADHRPGWDLTFSAPKSVSVLWSQLPSAERIKITQAHAVATKKALDFVESSAGLTRRGKGGKKLEKAGLIFATFEHGTSRAQDPQLHTHCLLMNISVRQDGTTGTVSSRSVFQTKMTAGSIYRTELSHQLQKELGVKVEKVRDWFEVVGVDK
jgi:conjugative relaxase-like TrwC/TraI family protein